MKSPRTATLTARLALPLLGLAASCLLPTQAHAAFGLTNSGGYYTVDNGANVVFKIRQSTADFTSCKYKGVEYQSQTQTGHIESGFGNSASVSASVSGDVIKVTCDGTVGGDAVTHYYIVQRGVDNIYMATYVPTNGIGEIRWIGYFTSPITYRPPGMASREPSDDATVIEAGDTFKEPNGQTRSKYMGCEQMKDWDILGTHGPNFGIYMAFGTRESSKGGPFQRDIQTCDGVVYNYMYSGHHQLDPGPRGNVLHGPFALMFVNGTTVPTSQPDYSFIANLGLKGYVPASGRGRVILNGINGRDTNYTYTVGYDNDTAQYWTTASASSGSCGCYNMKPGTYDMTIYKGELPVYKAAGITVTAGGATTLNTKTVDSDPSTVSTVWRIGNWDGTPLEFKYGRSSIADGYPYINVMHPSDVRESWTDTTFTVGSSATNVFPAIQWKDVNNPTTVKFNLSSSQVKAHTVKIGITDAFGGGRPKITVNSWTSSSPSSSAQPDGRSFTIGTYRGYNTTYTYNVPASAFVSGTNTMTISVISGTTSEAPYLSASVGYDCVELDN